MAQTLVNVRMDEEVKKEMYNCSLDIRKLDEKMQQLNEFVNKYNKE